MPVWYVIGNKRNGERVVIEEKSTEYKALQRQLYYAQRLEGYESITIEEDRPVSSSNGNGRGTLKLSECEAMTPAVSGVQALKNQLQLALFDAVTPKDVKDMAVKLKEKALAGDLKAMRLLLELVMPKEPKIGKAVFVNNGQTVPTTKSRVVGESEEE